MTDKTKKYGLTESSMMSEADLIEKIGWYLDRYTDGPTPREKHAESIMQVCIESEEAREHWQKQFVEQACELSDQCNYNSSEHRMPDTRTAYNVGIDDFMRAIRDKFK